MDFAEAVKEVRNGATINATAKKYGLCRGTLSARVKGLRTGKHGGHTRLLTYDEERFIADILRATADVGVPLKRRNLVQLIMKTCDLKGMKRPSPSWYTRFFARHPEVLDHVIPSNQRRKVRERSTKPCDEWVAVVSKLNMESYMSDPAGVFNLDKTAFRFIEGALGSRVKKNVSSITSASDPCSVTVLSCGNAAGVLCKPLILSSDQIRLGSRYGGTEETSLFSVKSSDEEDDEVFAIYIKDNVIPNMTAEKNVIFVENHSSHASNMDFLEACVSSQKNIRVVSFPAARPGKRQPSMFRPVQKYWMGYLHHLSAISEEKLTKEAFMATLTKNWHDSDLESGLRAGFRATGLFPYDPAVIFRSLQTEPEKPAPPVFANLFGTQIEELKACLRKFYLGDLAIGRIVDAVQNEVEGTSKSALDLAEAYREVLCSAETPNKRKLSDLSLDESDEE